MEELLIKSRLEEMIRYGYGCLARFPKSERFTLAAAQWRDDTWEAGIQILAAVEAGDRAIPSTADLMAELPAFPQVHGGSDNA